MHINAECEKPIHQISLGNIQYHSLEKAFYSCVCQIKEVFSGNQSWFAREFPIWFDELPIRALIEFGDIPASHL